MSMMELYEKTGSMMGELYASGVPLDELLPRGFLEKHSPLSYSCRISKLYLRHIIDTYFSEKP